MGKNQDLLEKIIFEIENDSPRIVEKKAEDKAFELTFDPVLTKNLSGGIATFLVRAILNKLNINEHHLERWSLENKYWQYQVLNYYNPGCMAETISLSELLDEKNGVQRIKELCRNGFFIKATLGDGSGRENRFDRTDELDEIISEYKSASEYKEKWILQKKLNLKYEYRIHTFGRDLIHGLTFKIEGQYLDKNFEAEEFVKKTLTKLPDTLLQGTLIGWDIAVTDLNEFYVIETNITGFHPEFNRGFQTSGYFGDPDFGPMICAWLNNYFRNNYQISINSVEDILSTSFEFYRDFIFYTSIFNREHEEIISNKTKDSKISAIIYLEDDINNQLINLIEYFRIQHFCERYYLIVKEEYLMKTISIFSEKPLVEVLAEDTFFTTSQYELIKELTNERRRMACYYHAMGKFKAKSYFII